MNNYLDSIILANHYITIQRLDGRDCSKTKLAKKYLTSKINEALYEMSKGSK